MRRELHSQLAPYRRQHREVRWTRPETWHLTLLFLGSVDPGKVGLLERTLASVAARGMPYEVRVDAGGGHTGGGRSRRGEGVAWLGLSTGADKLIEVADLVAAACPPDITSGPSPRRTRSAHLTLVRKADEAVVQALRTQAHGPLGVGWVADCIELVRSHLGRGGARYETVLQATL